MIPPHAYTVTPTGCWEWNGPRNKAGYGSYRRDLFQVPYKEAVQLAHRHAYVLTHGPIPDGMCVCHTCDNPPCINPDHLFLGSQADNHHDAQAKGRMTPRPADTDRCRHGHYAQWVINSQGSKVCQACRRVASATYYRNGGKQRRQARKASTAPPSPSQGYPTDTHKGGTYSAEATPKPMPVGSPERSSAGDFLDRT